MSGRPRLLAALGDLDDLAGQALGMPGWALSDADLDSAVLDCSMLLARLAAVRLTLVSEIHGRGSALREGATSTAALLRARLRIRPVDAQRLVDLALAVDAELSATGTALATGTITAEQAQTIQMALRALPRRVDAATRRSAEQLLLDHAATFDPAELARLGRHLRETLTTTDTSPGGDNPNEGGNDSGGRDNRDQNSGDQNSGGDNTPGSRNHNPDEDADPADRRSLWITDLPDGMTRLSGDLDPEAAALLRTALDSLAAPAPAIDGTPDPRSPARRRADALVDLLHRTLDAATVPVSGGVRPHLTVTIPWATLVGRSGPAAATSWGQPLPRAVIQRLACDAEVSRVIVSPDSVPLDLGRAYRTVPGDLRKALIARDQGCAFPSCDRPPSWCQAHHIKSWIDNGSTSLDNTVLLCGYHHRHVHNHGWTIRLGADHRPEFIPPRWIDPTQTARRNPYTQPLATLFNTRPRQ